MRLAPELTATPDMAVYDRHRWQAPMTFGHWQVTTPSAIHGKAWSLGVGEAAYGGTRAGLEFELDSRSPAGRQTTFGKCQALGKFAALTRHGSRTTDETAITMPGFPRLECQFSGAQAGSVMLQAAFTTQRDSGYAQFGQHRWEVRSVNNLEQQQGSFPLARFGYEFLMGERVVAAVETSGNGRIWMLPELTASQQEELSAVMAALLFYGELIDLQDA